MRSFATSDPIAGTLKQEIADPRRKRQFLYRGKGKTKNNRGQRAERKQQEQTKPLTEAMFWRHRWGQSATTQ